MKKKSCGNCGYFMRYLAYGGQIETYGDCASLGMNKECNENKVDPFLPWARDAGYMILQVDANDRACGFHRKGRTPRVRRIIKENPDDYEQLRKVKYIGRR
jgi:hypothetical protein